MTRSHHKHLVFLGLLLAALAILPPALVKARILGSLDEAVEQLPDIALPTEMESSTIDPDVIVMWKDLGPPEGLGFGYDMAIDPLEPKNLYVGTGNGMMPVVYSKDYGQTWITQTVGLALWSGCQRIAVDPVSPNYIYAALRLSRGIYRSDDGGQTWAEKNSGFTPLPVEISAMFVHPITPTLVMVGSAVGLPYIYRSEDRGDTWTVIPLTEPTNTKVAQILVDPLIPSKIYAVVGGVGVFISTDAGITWDNSGFMASYLAIDPSDPNILYRLQCQLSRSEDGGLNWDLVETPAPCYQAVHMDPTDGQVLYLTSQYRRVTRSVDGGASWQILDRAVSGYLRQESWTLAIDPVDTTRLYLFSNGWYVSLYLDESVYLPIVAR